MKVLRCFLIISLALTSSWLFENQCRADDNASPANLPPDALDVLRKSLKSGTPEEKETALNVIRKLQPISLIPEIIEAIEDPTPLPKHGDTGWGFVAHQAASTMGIIGFAIDGIHVKTRGNGYDAYSFYNDQYKGGQKLKEIGRLSEVRGNWDKWWQSHKSK